MNIEINKFKRTFVFLLIISLVFNCSNSDDNNDNEEETLLVQSANDIVFGKVYGLCQDDCRDLFLITISGVYEDANNSTLDFNNTEFKGTSLTNSKFQFAKTLL